MNSPKWVKVALGQTGGQIAIILMSIPIIYLFGFREMRFIQVSGGSMEPTLENRDYIITLNQKEYHRGDVIVLDDPESPGEYIVKRIVAVGGDTVSINGGAVFINGEYISEPYMQEPPDYSVSLTPIPDHHVFVLGDNRNNSEDSHLWQEKHLDAHPDTDAIVGKARCIYFPYSRARDIHGYFFPVNIESAKAP